SMWPQRLRLRRELTQVCRTQARNPCVGPAGRRPFLAGGNHPLHGGRGRSTGQTSVLSSSVGLGVCCLRLCASQSVLSRCRRGTYGRILERAGGVVRSKPSFCCWT